MSGSARALQPPRGMKDYLPEELAKRRRIEETIRQLFRLYAYREVETPTVEHLELVAAKVGEETRRAMYAFKDLGGRDVALRPEGTAPIARLVASKLRTAPKPLRLGYVWDFYRYDEPQFGRFRRFYQGGFELFGVSGLEGDLETLIVALDLMTRLGFKTFNVKASNVVVLRSLLAKAGVSEDGQNAVLSYADKRRYVEALEHIRSLGVPNRTVEAVSKLFELRGPDYESILQEARGLCEGCPDAIAALELLQHLLDSAKVLFPSTQLIVDLGFARGLEYYTGVIFEVFVPPLEIALIGGGRYDRLVELFGGEPTAAVGCAPGIDRLLLAMEEKGLSTPAEAASLAYLIPLKGISEDEAARVAYSLRSLDLAVEADVSRRGLKRGLAYANQRHLPFAVILGKEEMARGHAVLRNMAEATQTEASLEDLAIKLKRSQEAKATGRLEPHGGSS